MQPGLLPLRSPTQVGLGALLGALASDVRLAILRALRLPRILREVEVTGEDQKLLARQSVRDHLDRLVEAGFVEARPSNRDARSPVEYALNHQVIFALAEELRQLAEMRPELEPAAPTRGVRPLERCLGEQPALVLVKGIGEGQEFPLDASAQGGGPWLIGRRRGLAVSLDFDPFVSAENSRIVEEDGIHVLEDLESSLNGTSLNFDPLPRRGRTPLSHGDVVGVGRTLLLYRRPDR